MGQGNGLPRHIAFILDGNGRWAEQRGLNRLQGHQAGVDATRAIVKALHARHIESATFYAFSTENWARPIREVRGLFGILERAIEHEALELHRNNIRVLHLGRRKKLSRSVQRAIDKAVDLTRANTGMTVCFALNYGSRAEIADAARRIALDKVPPEKVDETLFGGYLYTAGLPDVDLLVRTGGEVRVSNFLLWQIAYSELYFTSVLWPDFNEAELDRALLVFSQRQRRFGGLATKQAC